MTTAACGCSTQKLLSSDEIEACSNAANAVLTKASVSNLGIGPSQSGVFTELGMLGHFLSPSPENWKDAVVSVPFPFGILSVHVQAGENDQTSSHALPDVSVDLYLVREGRQPEWLCSGQLVWTVDAAGKTSIKAKPKKTPKTSKKYNWRCLAFCAPSCVTCLDDIQCWVICAGACVISCAQ